MNPLATVFPPNDFALLAVIVGLPLVGAFVNGVFGKRLGKEAVTLMALSSVGLSFLASVATFVALRGARAAEQAPRFVWQGWEWMRVSSRLDGPDVPIAFDLSVDPLSGTMILVITGVGFLIHLYSTKYMEADAGYHRFFAYLNLFVFSMLVLVLGDSLPVLFVGWEGVGLCSYLLIGFWFHEDANAAAGKKAFIANRVGDFGLLVAMGLLVYHCGALDWRGIDAAAHNLLVPKQVWPIGTHVPLASLLPDSAAAWLNAPRYATGATMVGLALLLGAAGKSAQIPLYVWLPDAMAGPTPVSALIHAATMVTAGVYLVCRLSGVFVLTPAAMFAVAFVGALTALFAATIALVQNDIKKVLAYSTVSQLGFMFLGAGVGAFSAGFFHVLTHAFFKACLFLGAGSVIHAMHARIHGTEASQDMRNMGGLRKFMPVTFVTFAAAWAAIVGFPLTSGFFSKDEILFKAFTSSPQAPLGGSMMVGGRSVELFTWPEWAPITLFVMGVAAATMTAFYMTRLIVGTFLGDFRGWTVVPGWKAAHGHGDDAHDEHAHDEHAHDEHAHDEHAHDEHAHDEPGHGAAGREGPEPHESPWQMTLPLVVLGALAVVAGALNAHALFHSHLLDTWLEPVFQGVEKAIVVKENSKALELPLLVPGLLAFAAGVGGAWWAYVARGGEPMRALAERVPGLHQLVYEKWRIDELYEETFLGAVDALAEFAVWFDKWVVDGLLAKLTALLVAGGGAALRLAQTGRTHAYAALMVVGMAGLGWFFTAPHAQAKVEANHDEGRYVVSAAPGLGYRYRWATAEDGSWASDEFGAQAKVELSLEVGTSRTVKLAVENAFGRVEERTLLLERPRPDRSGPGGATTIEINRGADGRLEGQVAPRPIPSGAFPGPLGSALRVPPSFPVPGGGMPAPRGAAPGGPVPAPGVAAPSPGGAR